MTKPEQAAEYMKRGFNCAQSVVKAFASEVDVDEIDAIQMAATFGGGMGRYGYVCGAVTGAALILGKQFGNTEPADIPAREKAYEAIGQLFQQFEKEHGTVMCKQLISVDMLNPEELKKARESGIFQTQCVGYVSTVARILEGLLDSGEAS